MRFGIFIIGGLLLAACDRGPAGEPDVAVVDFYAAVERGNCDGARARLAAPMRAKLDGTDGKVMSCEEFLARMRAHPIEQVIGTQPDGRERGVYLVRIRLRGRETESVLRVAAEEGRWKIFTL